MLKLGDKNYRRYEALAFNITYSFNLFELKAKAEICTILCVTGLKPRCKMQ